MWLNLSISLRDNCNIANVLAQCPVATFGSPVLIVGISASVVVTVVVVVIPVVVIIVVVEDHRDKSMNIQYVSLCFSLCGNPAAAAVV